MEMSMLKQLEEIITSMRTSGRRPLRIYCTYAQLMAIKDELRTVYHVDPITASKLELFGIPLQLTPPGSGLWVSCMSDSEVAQ